MAELSIQELGAIGELLGSVAVLATLIYLGIQLRVAKKHIDLLIIENRTAGVRESFLAVSTNDSLANALNKAGHMQWSSFRNRLEEEHGLTDVESLQVTSFMVAQTRHAITQHLTITDPKQRALNDGVLKSMYSRGLHRLFWDEVIVDRPENFDLEYVGHVKKLLADE